jgi:hypothetical protein
LEVFLVIGTALEPPECIVIFSEHEKQLHEKFLNLALSEDGFLKV